MAFGARYDTCIGAGPGETATGVPDVAGCEPGGNQCDADDDMICAITTTGFGSTPAATCVPCTSCGYATVQCTTQLLLMRDVAAQCSVFATSLVAINDHFTHILLFEPRWLLVRSINLFGAEISVKPADGRDCPPCKTVPTSPARSECTASTDCSAGPSPEFCGTPPGAAAPSCLSCSVCYGVKNIPAVDDCRARLS